MWKVLFHFHCNAAIRHLAEGFNGCNKSAGIVFFREILKSGIILLAYLFDRFDF